MAVPGVVGVAVGEKDDRPVINVMVRRRTAELDERIPPEIEGIPVRIREVGDIEAPPPS